MCLTVAEDLSAAEAEPVRVSLLVTAQSMEDNSTQEEAHANSIEQCDKDEESLRQSGHPVGGNWYAAVDFLRRKVESSPLADLASRTPVSCAPEELPSGSSDLSVGALGLHGTSPTSSGPAQQHQSPSMGQQSAAGPVAVHMEVTSCAAYPAVSLRLEVKEDSTKALGVTQQPAPGRLRGMTDQVCEACHTVLSMLVVHAVYWLMDFPS